MRTGLAALAALAVATMPVDMPSLMRQAEANRYESPMTPAQIRRRKRGESGRNHRKIMRRMARRCS